jgi:hypothetical protein
VGVLMDVSPEAQRHWPRTPGGRKIACPECGLTGYLGGSWVEKHAEHVTCSCGRRITSRGLVSHRVMMTRHGRPCPERREQ